MKRGRTFSTVWGEIEPSLKAVISLKPEGTQCLPIAEDIYALCNSNNLNYPDLLYKSILKLVETYVTEEIVPQILASPEKDYLSEYVKLWTKYETGSSFLYRLCSFLNRKLQKKISEDSSKIIKIFSLTTVQSFSHGKIPSASPGPLGAPVSFRPAEPCSTPAPPRAVSPLKGNFKCGVFDTHTLCMLIWKECVYEKNKDILIGCLLDMIEKARKEIVRGNCDVLKENGTEDTFRNFVMSVIKFTSVYNSKKQNFAFLEIFKSDVGKFILSSTEKFYTNLSRTMISNDGILSYIMSAVAIFKSERHFMKAWVSERLTLHEHKNILKRTLVKDHMTEIIKECYENFLRSMNFDLLAKGYALLKYSKKGLHELKAVIVKWSTEEYSAKKLSEHPKEDYSNHVKYVESIIELINEFTMLHEVGLCKSSYFMDAFGVVFQKVINNGTELITPPKTAEMLAKYCDYVITKNVMEHNGGNAQSGNDESAEKSSNTRNPDKVIHDILTVFSFVSEKDVFLAFYSKLLAKRLLSGVTTPENDQEQTLIAGFKKVCGYEYVVKLMHMLSDITKSHDTHEKFQEYIVENEVPSLPKLDFTVQVLTSGSWPMQAKATSPTIILPEPVQRYVDVFETFYKKKHSGRRLVWLYNLSKGDIKCNFFKRPYEFQMSSFQVIALMLFNKHESVDPSVDAAETGLSQEELESILSLFAGIKLLKKTPEGKFILHKGFFCKKLKTKIPTSLKQKAVTPSTQGSEPSASKEATSGSNESEESTVNEDRKLFLQATIVRIMKSRKTLSHKDLVTETISQTKGRFTPQISMIKKVIELLIEGLFLKRISRDEYQYIS